MSDVMIKETAAEAWKRVAALERRLDRLGRAYTLAYELPTPRDHQRMIAVEEAQMRVGAAMRKAGREAQILESEEIWPDGLPAHP